MENIRSRILKCVDRDTRKFPESGLLYQNLNLLSTTDISSEALNGLLIPLGVPKGRWTEITMDFAGPLPLTKSGNDLIVVFVDRFSKMVHMAPLKQQCHGAKETTELFIDHMFKLDELSEKIVSHRGSQFVSAFLQVLMKTLGTEVAMSTAFHPQTDGQSERTIRTVKQMLRAFCHDKLETWIQYLAMIEFACNNSVNASMKFTQFSLNFGKHPSVSVHMQTGFSEVRGQEEVDSIFKRPYEGYVLAKAHLEEAQEKMANRTNRHWRDHNYYVGDEVWLQYKHVRYGPNKSTIFDAQWIGSYRITRLIGRNTVQLALPSEMKMHNTFNVEILSTLNSIRPINVITSLYAVLGKIRLLIVNCTSSPPLLPFKIIYPSTFVSSKYRAEVVE